MANQQGLYDGRRGQKRLKAIERQTEIILEEIASDYDVSKEMMFMRNNVRWEGTAELIFAMARRNVHYKWRGLRDYGFIRLCYKWISAGGLSVMTPKMAAAMLRNVLPEEMCTELGEELSALEIF